MTSSWERPTRLQTFFSAPPLLQQSLPKRLKSKNQLPTLQQTKQHRPLLETESANSNRWLRRKTLTTILTSKWIQRKTRSSRSTPAIRLQILPSLQARSICEPMTMVLRLHQLLLPRLHPWLHQKEHSLGRHLNWVVDPVRCHKTPHLTLLRRMLERR